MNEVDWQEIRDRFSQATLAAGLFSEAIPEMPSIQPIEPTWKDRLATILYCSVYFISYYPLRWIYITWDAIRDAFNDAWERY